LQVLVLSFWLVWSSVDGLDQALTSKNIGVTLKEAAGGGRALKEKTHQK
jgi:hypothetical protein